MVAGVAVGVAAGVAAGLAAAVAAVLSREAAAEAKQPGVEAPSTSEIPLSSGAAAEVAAVVAAGVAAGVAVGVAVGVAAARAVGASGRRAGALEGGRWRDEGGSSVGTSSSVEGVTSPSTDEVARGVASKSPEVRPESEVPAGEAPASSSTLRPEEAAASATAECTFGAAPAEGAATGAAPFAPFFGGLPRSFSVDLRKEPTKPLPPRRNLRKDPFSVAAWTKPPPLVCSRRSVAWSSSPSVLAWARCLGTQPQTAEEEGPGAAEGTTARLVASGWTVAISTSTDGSGPCRPQFSGEPVTG